VADQVVGHAFHVSQSLGHQRLSSFKGLDLHLLDDAQHHRLVGRVKVQADDLPDFHHEKQVSRKLEMLLAVGA